MPGITLQAGIMAGIVASMLAAVLFYGRRGQKTFLTDEDGVTVDEFAAVASLILFLFVGINLALCGPKVTAAQVDLLEVLTWPILAVVARRAVERFGLPRGLRSKGAGSLLGGGYDQGGYYSSPQEYQPRNEGGGEGEEGARGGKGVPSI